MPRCRYAGLRPRLRALAAAHGIEYRESGEAEMLVRNYSNYARVAAEPAVPGAPEGKKGTTI